MSKLHGNEQCECIDVGCGACAGRCTDKADYILFRIDMADYTGTAFCEECAADAMESGLFSEEEPDESLDWDPEVELN